jgi:hypothetical protein
MDVTDTWAFGEPKPSEYSNAFARWTELWTLDACGNWVEVEVNYMLHESGIVDLSVSEQPQFEQ